jgi:hypothetical protein
MSNPDMLGFLSGGRKPEMNHPDQLKSIGVMLDYVRCFNQALGEYFTYPS